LLNLTAKRTLAESDKPLYWPLIPSSTLSSPSLRPEIEVTRHKVYLRNLPSTFQNLRIVHLTDIHHSKYVSFNAVYRMVALTNRLRPDLVVLTGDYITWSKKYILPVCEALKDLRSRLGVFAVLGNHDVRVDAEGISNSLERVGIRVLRNTSTRIGHGQQSLYVVGVDEYSYGQSDLDKALQGIPESTPRILLAHNPEIIAHAAARDIDFIAAGHTHGGQVKLPYLRSLNNFTQPNQEFLEGFVSVRNTQMYISRGLGKVIVPLRIKCPPELPVYSLRNLSNRF